LSNSMYPLELREAAQRVISLPSRTRSAPYTQVFSGPRP
jgi:hypothetical protein